MGPRATIGLVIGRWAVARCPPSECACRQWLLAKRPAPSQGESELPRNVFDWLDTQDGDEDAKMSVLR